MHRSGEHFALLHLSNRRCSRPWVPAECRPGEPGVRAARLRIMHGAPDGYWGDRWVLWCACHGRQRSHRANLLSNKEFWLKAETHQQKAPVAGSAQPAIQYHHDRS